VAGEYVGVPFECFHERRRWQFVGPRVAEAAGGGPTPAHNDAKMGGLKPPIL
jgi:hypothetical protein